MGVIPQIEMWEATVQLDESAQLLHCNRSDHPKACFLGDAYHTYKGGSGFDGIKLLSGNALKCYHMNDYPVIQPRETIRDEHRVYP